MNRVRSRRGIRLVSRKLRSSCSTRRRICDRRSSSGNLRRIKHDSMEWSTTTLGFYGLGAASVATSLMRLRRRLELFKAKHATLTGHANLARRLAALVPFYDYDGDRFFCSDDPPKEIAARRRAGFMRLSELYASRFAESANRTAEAA